MNRALLSSRSCDWETPQDFFDELDKEFHFDLDPCATRETAKCFAFFTPQQDGLKQNWAGRRVFMNPPYGRQISRWVRKAFHESARGALVVCLLPARTDTKWWWDYCHRGEIRFLKGRLRFRRLGRSAPGHGSAPFPSAIVIFRPRALPEVHRVETGDST